MQTKLLLVDFDGTLVDTRRANFCAYRDALREVGVELDEAQYFARFYGMRCEDFLREVGVQDVDLVRRRKIELYPNFFETLRLNRWLYDFVVDFRRGGGKAWIVSTGQALNIENVMRYLEIGDMFDGVITGSDIGDDLRAKPFPDCFLRAMEIEDCSAQESLIFEDSAVGIAAAEASGAPFVKVTL